MHAAAIDIKFKMASQEFTRAYLANGIYPEYPYLMKTFLEPVNMTSDRSR